MAKIVLTVVGLVAAVLLSSGQETSAFVASNPSRTSTSTATTTTTTTTYRQGGWRSTSSSFAFRSSTTRPARSAAATPVRSRSSTRLQVASPPPSTPVRIEGGTLRTWPIPDETDFVHLYMHTEGRPLEASVQLWHGPDYTATKTSCYTEDGLVRPFNLVVACPKDTNTVAVYNTRNGEYPINARLELDQSQSLTRAPDRLYAKGTGTLVQGGKIASFPFDPKVKKVQILLKTDGRNLKARIELMQGPNNDKQVIEFYSSDGKKRPFFCVVDTPGIGNMVRLINENTLEYPFTACVEPYEFHENMSDNPFMGSGGIGDGAILPGRF